MPECPRCHQRVDSQAVACPVCQFDLKAFGHPGIPLHRATGKNYLCATCLYHQDDSCNFPQRPLAKECILYQNPTDLPHSRTAQQLSKQSSLIQWGQQHVLGLTLGGLFLVALLLSLL